MKRYLTSTFLIYAILFVSFFTTACPKRTDIATAKKRSAQLAGISDSAADVTLTLFRNGVLSLDRKDQIADAFIKLSKAGIKFDAAVAALEAEWGDKPPKLNIEQLFTVFNDEVVTFFLEAVDELAGVNITPYQSVITALKNAVLAIAKAFGKKQAVAVRLEAVQWTNS